MLVHIVVVSFFAVLLYYSVIFVAGVSGHRAPALQIPMELPYASVVVGTALMLFEVVRSAWREMTGRAVVDAETER